MKLPINPDQLWHGLKLSQYLRGPEGQNFLDAHARHILDTQNSLQAHKH